MSGSGAACRGLAHGISAFAQMRRSTRYRACCGIFSMISELAQLPGSGAPSSAIRWVSIASASSSLSTSVVSLTGEVTARFRHGRQTCHGNRRTAHAGKSGIRERLGRLRIK